MSVYIKNKPLITKDDVLDACVSLNKLNVIDTSLSNITYTSSSQGTLLNVFQPVINKTSGILFVGSTASPFDKTNLFGSLQVAKKDYRSVCLFGNVSAITLTPLSLTICYSNDGSTWFESSLAKITLSSVGDFSREFQTSASYVGLFADRVMTAEIYYSLTQ